MIKGRDGHFYYTDAQKEGDEGGSGAGSPQPAVPLEDMGPSVV